MLRRLRQFSAGFDERTGLLSACQSFLFEEMPAGVGWAQVFGSIALFLFLVQALTGILLASDFAPVPGDAYRSLTYILKRVAGGHMIWKLHHWGASFLVIFVTLHMAQVFIYGAYQKPREATWLVGVCLFLLTLAFGLTGYLLPWDNRAYWGTIVTTRIIAGMPLLGSYLLRLIGAQNGIGVLTFSRFYALHTLVLPASSCILIGLHIWLVRRHGVCPPAGLDRPKETFYPKQAFRDVLAVFGVFTVLFGFASFADAGLERLADPTDTTYTPRPEWYFLFLFELMKIFPGALEIVATVLLPSLAVLLLVALPFLRSSRSFLNGRPAALVVTLLVFGVWAGLTVAGTQSTPHRAPNNVPSEALEWAQVPPEQIAGYGYFHSAGCGACHNLLSGSPKPGPTLMPENVHQPKEWLIRHFRTSTRRALPFQELNALLLLVATVNPDSMELLTRMSPQFIIGAETYVASGCASCHRVNGSGGGVGPALNGVAGRRSRLWMIDHFLAPQRLSPGSIMPAYQFSEEQREALLLYLLSLPE